VSFTFSADDFLTILLSWELSCILFIIQLLFAERLNFLQVFSFGSLPSSIIPLPKPKFITFYPVASARLQYVNCIVICSVDSTPFCNYPWSQHVKNTVDQTMPITHAFATVPMHFKFDYWKLLLLTLSSLQVIRFQLVSNSATHMSLKPQIFIISYHSC
jgi:hypothetical protein